MLYGAMVFSKGVRFYSAIGRISIGPKQGLYKLTNCATDSRTTLKRTGSRSSRAILTGKVGYGGIFFLESYSLNIAIPVS